MIQFDHVTKRYGAGLPALDDVSCSVADGEFVYLIGPSGAGKTTLLRLLLREIVPSSGTVLIDGTDIAKLHTSQIYLMRRNIGMVFQDFKLLGDRTVFENVSLALEIRGRNQEEITKSVRAVVSLVGLSEKLDLFPQQLSAGELQRASIARAIVGGPKVLLADEPTGNLDPDTAWEVLGILDQINAMGTTVVMATHNATIVNDTKRRTVSMSEGRLVSDESRGKYHVTSHAHKGKHTKEAPPS